MVASQNICHCISIDGRPLRGEKFYVICFFICCCCFVLYLWHLFYRLVVGFVTHFPYLKGRAKMSIDGCFWVVYQPFGAFISLHMHIGRTWRFHRVRRERERESNANEKKSTCERMCVVTINMGQQALNISVCIMNETICISNVLFSI